MRKLCVVVEGDSEERFVRGALRNHLAHLNTVAIKVETSRSPLGRAHRGGGDWTKWRADIRRALPPSGSDRVVTTLFDLYGLPRNFPRPAGAEHELDTNALADRLETGMAKEVGDPRFVPNIVRHEFETLVLASLDELEQVMHTGMRDGVRRLRLELAQRPVEEINCGAATAPSKRLAAAGIGFSKRKHGVPAVERAGIAKLKVACPRFAAWVTRLESL